MVHGLNTYIIGNRTNPSGIIVMYPDIFGLPFPNNRLLADGFAKSGEWLVYLVDFFEGDPVRLRMADLLIPTDASKQNSLCKWSGVLAEMPSFLMWMGRHKKAHCDKVCMDFLTKLRRATPNLKIGMVGYCWGGKYALRAGLEENMIDIDGAKKPLIDAAVALHPSNLTLPDDAEKLVVPTSIGWGKEDHEVKFEQKATIEGMHKAAEQDGRKVPEVVHQVYEPGRHGFAVRGNPDDPKEKKCLEDSEKQVLEWFDRWL